MLFCIASMHEQPALEVFLFILINILLGLIVKDKSYEICNLLNIVKT